LKDLGTLARFDNAVMLGGSNSCDIVGESDSADQKRILFTKGQLLELTGLRKISRRLDSTPWMSLMTSMTKGG
jgi:hypothetical protein